MQWLVVQRRQNLDRRWRRFCTRCIQNVPQSNWGTMTGCYPFAAHRAALVLLDPLELALGHFQNQLTEVFTIEQFEQRLGEGL